MAIGYHNAGSYSEIDTIFRMIVTLTYSFHMALYMMISGYVYRLAYWDKNDGSVRKSKLLVQIKNLAVVYFVYSIAFGLLQYGSARFTNTQRSLHDLLLIRIKPIDPYWYLYVLVCFYIIFALIKIDQYGKKPLIILMIAAMLSSWIRTDWFAIHDFLHYAFFFCLGMLLHQKQYVEIFANRRIAIGMGLGAIVLIAATWNMTVITEAIRIDDIPAVSILVGAACAIAIWYMFQYIPFLHNNHFFATIGRYSLEVYVIHCAFTAGFRTVLPKIGVANGFISLLLNAILSTAIPIFVSKFCKLLHIHDLFFRPISYLHNFRDLTSKQVNQ